jgi:serine/threonine protein kinase
MNSEPKPPLPITVDEQPPPGTREVATPGPAPAPPTTEERAPAAIGSFGRYQLQRLLGQGGMGEVYLAQDTQLGRAVALKILQLTDTTPAQRKRFLREAQASAVLDHPSICPVFDVGEIDGRSYLTMAFIEGVSLAQALRERGPFDPHEAANLAITIARAMQHAHEQGILHRDLKPGNIQLDANGQPIIMDFGLAFRYDADTTGPTSTAWASSSMKCSPAGSLLKGPWGNSLPRSRPPRRRLSASSAPGWTSLWKRSA